MRLQREDALARLDAARVARLATLGPEGPRQVPVVFVLLGETLWSPVDGKPKRGVALARLRDVAADPRVSLLVDHYDDDWTRLWWVRVEGRAGAVTADPPPGGVADALRAKYPQYAATPLFRGPPTLLRVEIAAVTGWSAAPGLPTPGGAG